jgi:uncharacterized membrane protein YvbJ
MEIKCPKCQHENPDQTSYCGKCGTKLDQKAGPTQTIDTTKQELSIGQNLSSRYKVIEELPII